jgi:hypothetical protein
VAIKLKLIFLSIRGHVSLMGGLSLRMGVANGNSFFYGANDRAGSIRNNLKKKSSPCEIKKFKDMLVHKYLFLRQDYGKLKCLSPMSMFERKRTKCCLNSTCIKRIT